MAESRRTRMTKMLIRDALIELLDERPLEKISVTDICQRADVNRSTFYAHYDGVSALVQDTEDDVLAHVPMTQTLPNLSKQDAMLKKLTVYLEYIRENERLFRVLILRADRSSFNERLTQMVMEQHRPLVHDSEKAKYAYAFCITGVFGMLKEWMVGGFVMETQELAYLMLDMSLRLFQAA